MHLQAAPDHPYVKIFRNGLNGDRTERFNMLKIHQKNTKIFNRFILKSTDWKNLWKELLDVALFWIEECDIRVYRVDNPHTKPFYFWGWLIGEIKKKHPDVLFLAEAFTRPKIMNELAKQGFTIVYLFHLAKF
jgi:starch synthase (maltosyl-transferring)